MNNGYFDNLRPFGSGQDAAGQGNPPSAGQNPVGPAPTPDGSYHYQGSELSGAQEQPSGGQSPEYEVSYNSRSGSYHYVSPGPAAPAPKKSHTGLWVSLMATTLVLSCILGSVCGLIASAASGGKSPSGANGSVNQPSAGAIVEKYTTVIENGATNQSNLLTKAAEVAHSSVVIIDTFLSEQYEQLNQPSGSGSGVIWSTDGYIVTCNHVVDKATIIKVTLVDGKSYIAEVVGTDAKTDLAVLKINATESTLIPAVLRDDTVAPLVLAESVIAIGNPLGVLGGTVTDGILSTLERNVTIEGVSMTLLQTSAAVNSGNSGGGLFDINGSLVGIVNAKSAGENVEGLGFAIPISTTRQVANELIQYGYVLGRPQIGVKVVSVTAENSSYIFGSDYYPDLKQYATRDTGWGRLSVVTGVYLIDASAVQYGEGATKLEYGDRITYVGGTEIVTADDITTALADYSTGDTITLTVVRNRMQTITIPIVLGQAGAQS